MAGDEVHCTVVHGGRLAEHKGINLPHARIAIAGLTDKDREDLRFGLSHGVDMVALSFVSGPEDAREARRIIDESGREDAAPGEDRTAAGPGASWTPSCAPSTA